jgi:hypothetical protein
MHKLRFGLAVNVIWFFLFYNIERINKPINIASFVYAMVPMSVALLAIFPVLHRRQAFTLFMLGEILTYLLIKLNLGYEVIGDQLPLTLFEVTTLTISAVLFRFYLGNIFSFEDLLQQITFRQLGMPPRIVSSLQAEELYREVKRSRRFQNPLVFSLVEPDLEGKKLEDTKLMRELQTMLLGRFSQARIANIISETLRDSDLIVQYGNGFAVLMPETMSADGDKLIYEIQQQVRKELGLELKIGMASFPENAFTLNGLVEHAKRSASEANEDPTHPAKPETTNEKPVRTTR